MAVVKTVKPGGGGDFVSLQGWWDWAKTQATADQWAECYGGGSLGLLDAKGATTFTTSAESYPRVYAAAGHRHRLAWDTDKAHIDGGHDAGLAIIDAPVDHMRIEGLAIKCTGSATGIQANTGGTAGPFYYDGMLVIGGAGGGTNQVLGMVGYVREGARNGYITNCLFVDCGLSGLYLVSYHATWYILNCGVVNCGNSNTYGGIRNVRQDVDRKMYVKNCFVLNTGACPCFTHQYYPGTYEISHSFSSDSSMMGSGYSATDCVEEIEMTGQLVDYEGDWRTAPGSDFVGAGEDLSADFTTDAGGRERDAPWWVGPWQGVDEAVFKAFWVFCANQISGRK